MWIQKNTNNTDTNNKIELSLSAIMFFSPLIKNLLKNNKNITDQEKTFIKWFIKLGYFNILLLLINIWLQISFYLTNQNIFDTASFVFMIVLICSLVIGSIYAISGNWIPLLKDSSNHNNSNNNTLDNKLINLLNYIPFYNIYLRYKNHNFNAPDLILKESILRWSLFSMIFIVFQRQTINRTFVSILWVRIIALMNDIDFSKNTKEKLNQLFNKNPEELRWYILWIVSHIFTKSKISLKENINIKKIEYSLLFKLDNKQILLEYIILLGLSSFGIYKWYVLDNSVLIIAILFIAVRYIIMIIKRNHLPHLPVVKEITNILFK